MSAYTTYPSVPPTGTVYRQAGAKEKTTRQGVTVLTETYRGTFADIISIGSLTVVGTAHADFPLLTLWSTTITEDKAGWGTLECEYRGTSYSTFPDPTYSLDRTTRSEPLSTHPLWVSNIAGTPATPLNGAIFVSTDKTGNNYNPAPSGGNPGTFDPAHATFSGWTTGSIFEGVEDYLAVGQTWSTSYISDSQPDLSGVGQIDASPAGSPPTLPTNFFWMYMGGSSDEQGGVYHVQEHWQMTGGYNSAATTILYNSGF